MLIPDESDGKGEHQTPSPPLEELVNAQVTPGLDIVRATLGVLFIGALIASTFWIMKPFLTSLIWATIIVVATWPILLWLQARLWDRRGLAVMVMTIVLLLVMIVPVSLAVGTIVSRSEDIAVKARSLATLPVPPPPEWLGRIPLAGRDLTEKWREVAALSTEERSAKLQVYARGAVRWFAGKAGGIGIMFIQFLLTVIISAMLFMWGERAASSVRNFARRLAGRRGEEQAILAAKAVRGVALGIVLTAIIQTGIGTAGLTVAAVPGATILAAVMFMLCLAQIGPTLILIPAVFWTYWTSGPLYGTILLVISLVAMTIDNFLRPILIKRGADLPLVLIFAGVIGGLLAFGVIGLFIGPVLLAVAWTLLGEWVSDGAQEQEALTRNE